ncbi:MAG: GyrI-like domain-containing protein [bacterium]
MRTANVSLPGLAAIAALLAVLAGCGGQPAPQQTETKPELNYAASLKVLDSMTVASLEVTGPFSLFPEAMGKLMAWAGTAGVVPAGAPFGVFLSSPETPADSAAWEICLPVPTGTIADPASGVTVKPFGGIQVAFATYTGPYDGIGAAHDSLEMWVDAKGMTVAGPAIEFYLSDPQATPPESLKTEIAVAVKTGQPEPAGQ